MRVLIVGPAQEGEMCWFIRVALERMGHSAVAFDDRAYLTRMPGRPGKAFQLAQTRLKRGPLYAALQRVVLRAARGADLILTVKGENLATETVASLVKVAPTVNWYCDHPFLEQNFDGIDAYTLFCPKDTWSTARLRSMGFANVRHLPHSGDPILMQSAATERFDIGMLGSDYPYRAVHVRRLAADGMSMQVHGDRVPGLPDSVVQHTARAMGQEYADAMSSSRLILNTHAPMDVAGGNQRLLDAAAAGRAQLTEPLPDSLQLFPAGGPVWFDSLVDLEERARELLADAQLRRRLEATSLAQVREAHTYEHRISTLLEWLD